MNQRRADCLKRRRLDPEVHSEQQGRGTLAQRTDTGVGKDRSVSEGGDRECFLLPSEMTAFYTSTGQYRRCAL
jgi:hypothetical protein